MPQPTKIVKTDKKRKITDFTIKTRDKPEAIKINIPVSTKRTSSSLSPTENLQQAKKPNMLQEEKALNTSESKKGELKEVIGPLIAEVTQPLLTELKLLRESVDSKYSKLEETITSQRQEVAEEIHKLESTITKQSNVANTELLNKINSNQEMINKVLIRNDGLEKENMALKERLDKIEMNQLSNNVIITGVAEQTWETYEHTKQRVLDTVVASLGRTDNTTEIEAARNTAISYCTRLGKQCPNFDRPISVTFQRKEDKDKLMEGKQNLPMGVYVNEEFPLHIKRARDRLRPILKYIKTKPAYKDKCRIQGDKLIVEGVKYSMENIGELPTEIAAFKAAEKSNDSHIVFHGELSPYSNFHPCKFTLDNIVFPTAEHYIQYQKALIFGDSVTANNILKSETALDAKRLSYRIVNFNRQQWVREGYKICERGVRAKFEQNELLMNMLKTTQPRVLAESSLDRLWGTGLSLNDKDALNANKWNGEGWLSRILMGIRDDHT